MGPKSNDKYSYKKREDNLRYRQRPRLELCGSQAKERLEPPEAGGGKEGFSPRAFRGTKAPADTLI